MGAWTVAPKNQRDNPNRSAPAKVWATIANFHNMSWLPGVVKTTGQGGNEPNAAKRRLTLNGGAMIDESLYKYDAAEMSYSYRIDKVDVKVWPVNNYSSTIAVRRRAAKASSNGAAPFTGAIPTTIRRRN